MLELPRRVPYATWPGTLAVAAGIALYVGGLTAWDRHTPGYRELEPGQAVVAGDGARFVPAEGWDMDLTRTRAGRSLLLVKGGYSFAVATLPWAGGPEGPVARQQRVLERGQGLHIDGDAAPFFNSWGLGGSTFAYYGPQLAGRQWLVVDVQRRVLLQVDFRGPAEGLGEALADAKAMVDSMDLEGGG